MYLRYGSHEHGIKTVTPIVTSVPLRTPRGEVYGIQQTITCREELIGNSTSEVATAVEELIEAYSRDGQDFVWYFTDGSETPEINLVSRDCIGGVQVVQRPSFTAGEGAEYSNYRKAEWTIQAVVRVSSSGFPTIWNYQQSVQRTGNGRESIRWVDLKYERAQKQRNRAYTRVTATQSGQLVGTLRRLPHLVPSPLWPFALKNDAESRGYEERPEQFLNGVGVGFSDTWNYQFENNGPLPGMP